MKTTRLVVGIISIVLFLVVAFQSCAAGIGNTLADNGEVSGSAGVLLAFAYLIAGIISVAARKSQGGAITALCFYILGGIIGIANVGSYKDLMVWSVLSFIFAAILLVTVILQVNQNKSENNNKTVGN